MKEQRASPVNERKRCTMAGPIAATAMHEGEIGRGRGWETKGYYVYGMTSEQMVRLRRRKNIPTPC